MKTIFTFCIILAVIVARAQIQIDMQKAMQFDKDGLTLLHETNNIDTLKYLIEHGADPNTRSRVEIRTNSYDGSILIDGGYTPLMRRTNYNAVKYLLEQGADPNAKSTGGLQSSVLYMAILNGLYDRDNDDEKIKEGLAVCKLLLEHGANPNVQNKYGLYPLSSISSTSTSSYAVMKLLLDYGANPNLQDDKSGYTPFMLLTKDVSTIFEEHDCNKNEEYKTLFNLFKLLLEYRADPNIQNALGEYPLMEIIKWHNYQYNNDEDTTLIPTLRLFVAYGANPNLVDTGYRSCLSVANKPERKYLKTNAGAHRSFDPFYANMGVAAVQTFNQGLNQPDAITEALQQGQNEQNNTGNRTNSATSQQQAECAKKTQEEWKTYDEYQNVKNGVPPTMLNGEKAKLLLAQLMLRNCKSVMSPEDIKITEELVARLESEIATMENQWNNSIKIGE